VLNTFPNRNQPWTLISKKGFFYSFFPFPRIKIESSKIDGSKPINGLIPENREHKLNATRFYVNEIDFENLQLTNTIAFHESHLLYAIKFFILNSNEIKLQNFAHCMPV